MNLILTLSLFALGAVLTALFGWLGARPRVLGKPRRLKRPWPILMMIASRLVA